MSLYDANKALLRVGDKTFLELRENSSTDSIYGFMRSMRTLHDEISVKRSVCNTLHMLVPRRCFNDG